MPSGQISKLIQDTNLTVEELLQLVDHSNDIPYPISEKPGEFFRLLYEQWHNNGGKEAGRYDRNSFRKIETEWLIGNEAIKSLYPKLSGKVKLVEKDANLLIDLFLSRWRFSPESTDSSSNRDGYIPFPCENRIGLRKKLVKALFSKCKSEKRQGLFLPSLEATRHPDSSTQSISEFVYSSCANSSALIVLSRQRTIIGPDPYISQDLMRHFWNIFSFFHKSDQLNGKNDRILIWVLDIGRRLVEDDSSFFKFYNVGLVTMQMIALANFDTMTAEIGIPTNDWDRLIIAPDPEDRRRRWHWFRERAAIVIQNLRPNEFKDFYTSDEKEIYSMETMRIGVTEDHILPSEVPATWLQRVRSFYGKRIKNLDQGTFGVLIQKSSKNERLNLSYLAHGGALSGEAEEVAKRSMMTLDLPSPGRLYDDAMTMLYMASAYKLGRLGDKDREKGRIATAYLSKQGFEVFNVRDFIQIFWSSIDLID